jgi:hypothetical protein
MIVDKTGGTTLYGRLDGARCKIFRFALIEYLHVAGIEAITLKMEAVAVSKGQEAELQGALHSARSLS